MPLDQTGLLCPTCGPVAPPDVDFRAWAYLDACAARLVVARTGDEPGRREERWELLTDGEPHLEVWANPGGVDAGEALPLSGEYFGVVQQVISQLPGVIAEAAKFGQMTGRVAMRVRPDLAAKLASGAASLMKAADGGFRGNIVNAAGAIIGQASFVPGTLATAGALAGWQVLSFLVAQKHLHDINERLERIESKVDYIIELHERRIGEECRADADQLRRLFARGAGEPEGDTLSKAEDVLGRVGQRHEQLKGLLGDSAKALGGLRGATWIGPTLGTATERWLRETDKFGRRTLTALANQEIGVMALTLAVSRRADAAYVGHATGDLRRYVGEVDAITDAYHRKARALLPRLDSGFRLKPAGAAARAAVASRLWQSASAQAAHRAALAPYVAERPHGGAQLCVEFDANRTVTSIRPLLIGN